jgi:uncharacterized protein YraI
MMTLKTTLVTAAIAAAVVLGSVVAAEAATVKYSTPLYKGPGFGRIGTVPAGSFVDIQGCDRGYCFVSRRGRDGFVSARAIGFGRGQDYNWWYRHPRHHGGWGGWGGPDHGACLKTPGFGFCVR